MAECPCQNCGHDRYDHRSGGLCDLCIPGGDSTGASSSCQTFVAPVSEAEADFQEELEARAYADGRNEGREYERERLRDLIAIAIGDEENCDCETDQVAHAHAASVLRDLQESLGAGRSATAERDRLLKLAEEMAGEQGELSNWTYALREFIRRAKEGA